MTIILDATDMILGRFASALAKKLLMGEKIVVVNAEETVIIGKKDNLFVEYKELHDRGHRYMGPFFPKVPHLVFKRTVRGMLPKQNRRGKAALGRIMVHIGVPENLEGMKVESLPEYKADLEKKKFVRLGDICKHLGWVPRV
ncbi:MAG: 50S ribosomal protein L13 [Candidatus Altiarchaeota archaeon]|nr:50S ribosomal protein L13 [Candidatus Altiarchaeota archaeon]